MSKFVLIAHNEGKVLPSGAFVRQFQGDLLLLLKRRGVLTEIQYRMGLRYVGETNR